MSEKDARADRDARAPDGPSEPAAPPDAPASGGAPPDGAPPPGAPSAAAPGTASDASGRRGKDTDGDPGADPGRARDDRAAAEDDPARRLKDDGRSRELGDLGSQLSEALAHLLPAGGVSMSGNFFLSETRLQDAVGGDKYTSAQGASFSGRVDSGRVPDRVLEEIRATFVAPDGHGLLEGLLRERSVVLLRAPSGWGGTTNSLRVLDRLCAGQVWKLNPEVRLGSLQVEHLSESGGYLAEALEPEQARTLRPFHLERLSESLKDRGCRLVVTVDTDSPLPRETLDAWLFDVAAGPGGTAGGAGLRGVAAGRPAGPDAHQLVRRHVAWHLSVAPDTEDTAFLTRGDIKELVDEAVAERLPVRRLADLSAMLTLVGRGEAEVAEVRGRFSAESDDRFRGWFERQDDDDQRSFVIALAVLNHLPEHVVGRAARLLADRLRALTASEETRPPDLFGTSRRGRLEAAAAESYASVENTPYGPSGVRGLRFLDDRYARRVIQHVWEEYPDAHPVLMDWLKQLAADPQRRIRMRAGAAIGLLSLFDFEWIRREFMIGWAADPDVRRREVVLGALQLPIREPRLAPLVSRMVGDWCHPVHPRPVAWTATRALGASVGRTMPARSLRLLRKLALDPRGAHAAAVGDSVTELFVDPEKDLAGVVLDHLLDWTDDDADGSTAALREVGVTSFLQLCYGIRAEVPRGHGSWPGVLWLAAQDDQQFRRVVTLLARTLDTPYLFPLGYEMLRRWVRDAQREEPLREPLGTLLAAIGTAEGDTEALRGYLTEWRSEEPGLGEAVGSLLKALDGKAVPR
ncbi:hypothetical protein ACFYYH_20165 [Streptomyces sp. NPDC002018]|uniref:hypothetical protein n=1 Tax=Streptomyces sp. NPDC002018 TaxID=3364629 RepID=UPI0036929D92